MTQESAGLIMYRIRESVLEILLVHPGGPFWKNKDAGAWSIPKGEFDRGADGLAAAQKEFQEELGFKAEGPFFPLGSIKLKSGKLVHGWAFQGDCDPEMMKSNLIKIEWPPRSGKQIEIPEVDRAFFYTIGDARYKINEAQVPLLEALQKVVPAEYEKSSQTRRFRETLFDL